MIFEWDSVFSEAFYFNATPHPSPPRSLTIAQKLTNERKRVLLDFNFNCSTTHENPKSTSFTPDVMHDTHKFTFKATINPNVFAIQDSKQKSFKKLSHSPSRSKKACGNLFSSAVDQKKSSNLIFFRLR